MKASFSEIVYPSELIDTQVQGYKNEACTQLGYEIKLSKRDNEEVHRLIKKKYMKKIFVVNFAFI